MPTAPQPPAFTPAAFTFAEVDAASRVTAAALLHLFAGFTTTAVLLIELRPILRAVVWLAGAV